MRARCCRIYSLLVLNTRSTWAEVAGEQKNLLKECMQVSHSSLSHCKTMVLHISHDTTLAYLVLENFRGLELPRTRTRTRTRTLAPRTRTRRTWKLTTTLFVAEVANLSRLSVTSMLYSHNSLPLESNYRQRCAKYRYMGFSPRYCIWQCCVSQTCQTSHCRVSTSLHLSILQFQTSNWSLVLIPEVRCWYLAAN